MAYLFYGEDWQRLLTSTLGDNVGAQQSNLTLLVKLENHDAVDIMRSLSRDIMTMAQPR